MATTGSMSAGVISLANQIEVRNWSRDYREGVIPLIQAYIEEACPDLVPSEANASAMFDSAGTMSLIAFNKKGEALAFTLLSPINNVQTKQRMLHSVGTYVVPDWRRQGIGERLRRMAMLIAKQEGFSMLQGVTYSQDKTNAILRLGGKVVGIVVECPL